MEDTQATMDTVSTSHGMPEAMQVKSHFEETTTDSSKPAPEMIAPKGYLPFVEARKFAESLNLKTRKEWRNYVKGEMPDTPPKPANVPAHPDGIYKVKGWQGWKYWLGTVEVGAKETH